MLRRVSGQPDGTDGRGHDLDANGGSPAAAGAPLPFAASQRGVATSVRLALSWASPTERSAVLGFEGEPTEPLSARAWARLWCVAMARMRGWSVVAAQGEDLLVTRGAERVLLCPVTVSPDHRTSAGAESLLRALDPVFGDRPWAFVLRRPIGPDGDVSRLVEPTRQWLARVDQARWDADYAIYEDTDLSIELRVMPERWKGYAGALLRVAQPPGADRIERVLGEIDALNARRTDPLLPVIPVVVADQPWRVGRRRLLQALYGKPLEVNVNERGVSTYTFSRSDAAWFGAGSASTVAAVWWLGRDPTDPTSVRGWSNENPWAACSAPRFVGTRLAVTAVGEPSDAQAPASLTRVRDPGGVQP